MFFVIINVFPSVLALIYQKLLVYLPKEDKVRYKEMWKES
jgi:hypothetical protein